MDLQQLIDRAEIADAITRYTLAVDEGDFDRLDTVFTPDAQIDYTESGGVADAYPAVKAWLAEALPGFSTHRIHMLGQISYEFDDSGDEAAVAAYFHNPMRIADGKGGERVVEVGGLYRHAFVRTTDGWQIGRAHV
mgnify:FL=1